MRSLCQWATSISTCHTRLPHSMWLLWAWLRRSEMPYLHKQLWLWKIHNGKECLLWKSGCNVSPEKAPQLLFSSTATAFHCNWQKTLWLCGMCHQPPQRTANSYRTYLSGLRALAYCTPKTWSFLEGKYPPWDSGSLVHKEMYLAHEQTQWQWDMLLSGSTGWHCHYM